jgi:DNA polymerase V
MSSTDDLPDGAPVGALSDDASGASRHGVDGRSVAAGFGSPADDSGVKRIDLNDALIKHPEATFLMRAKGEAMRQAGIDDDDVLLVDRALTATHGSVIVAVVDGDLVCRRLAQRDGVMRLEAAAPGHADIVVSGETPLEVWGVVTTVIKSLIP